MTERPAHGDTAQLPLCPGHALLVQSELALPGGGLPTWCRAGPKTAIVCCCSGLSESLWDFELYEKVALPLASALLGLGGCECVVKKPISAFSSMFWSKLPILEVSREGWGKAGGWDEHRQAERPTGPETGCSLSLQVTLALL